MNLTPRQPKAKIKCLVLGAASAGKTSLLRRFFYKTFDEGTRVPTLGSDWYTTRVKFPNTENGATSTTEEIVISVQMWDTPGRERFDNTTTNRRRQQQLRQTLGDSFLKHADAIMLVYDMTSSTSFKQLLKWYADLLELKRKHNVPLLVVANKLDLLAQRHIPPNQSRSPEKMHRDVLGLDGHFRGKDYRYEYQVSRIENDPRDTDGQTTSSSINSPASNSHYHHQTSPQHGSRPMEMSYLADRENWTSDGSYLASLATSEDSSHPDRDMVELWCMRNGLGHLEASAATGEGVEDCFQELIRLAMVFKQRKRVEADTTMANADLDTQVYNQELDLTKRYGPKEKLCCWPILSHILQPMR